jgi:hypothetical protein
MFYCNSINTLLCLLLVHSLKIKYGSTWGKLYGHGTGAIITLDLSLDEVITGVYVGFGKLDYGDGVPNEGLCYLHFNSTQRSYGPYDAGCIGTVTSYYNLSSGLAYMSGCGGWCISGLTFYHYP